MYEPQWDYSLDYSHTPYVESTMFQQRSSQLYSLQGDYLALHSHAIQEAQSFAAHRLELLAQAKRDRDLHDARRKELEGVRAVADEARGAIGQVVDQCEALIQRLAGASGEEELQNEVANALSTLFASRTTLVQAQTALTFPQIPKPSPPKKIVKRAGTSSLDKMLDKRAFRILMASQFGKSGRQADELFAAIDRDGSGVIGYNEFKRGAASGKLGALSIKDWERANGGGHGDHDDDGGGGGGGGSSSARTARESPRPTRLAAQLSASRAAFTHRAPTLPQLGERELSPEVSPRWR